MLLVLLPLLIHAEFPRGACGPSPLPLRVIPPPNASAAVARPPLKCAAFVFLHPQSSGGISVDSLLGIALASGTWECFDMRSDELARKLADPAWVAAHPRVYHRRHRSVSRRADVAPFEAVRAAFEAQGCRLVIGVVLRSPVSHVLSWWSHFGRKRYAGATLAATIESQPKVRRMWRDLLELPTETDAPALARDDGGAPPFAWADWVGLTNAMAASLVLLADTLALALLPNVHLTHYSRPAALLDTDGADDARAPSSAQAAPPERVSAAWLDARLGDSTRLFRSIERLARARLRAHAEADPTVAARVRALERSAPYDVKICSTAYCLLAQRRPRDSPPRDGVLFCRAGSERWFKKCARGPGAYAYGE